MTGYRGAMAIASCLLLVSVCVSAAEDYKLSPCAQDCGVGCVVMADKTPGKYDGCVRASYGDWCWGMEKMRAWAIWDISALPEGAVATVSIDAEIWPSGLVDHCTEFRALDVDPRDATAGDLWFSLQGGVYIRFMTGDEYGHRTTELGAIAAHDLSAAISAGRGWFAIGITAVDDSHGEARIAGWSSGSPVLHVSYAEVASEAVTWGQIKGLFAR